MKIVIEDLLKKTRNQYERYYNDLEYLIKYFCDIQESINQQPKIIYTKVKKLIDFVKNIKNK